MNWPLASDYQDAVQNPAQCFGDAQLKLCRPVVTRLGLPRVASGTFASVYELCNLAAHPPQRWAVRCFSRPGTDQQSRYALLSQYLGRLHMPELVGFAYFAQGIRIKGQWVPIVRMEWVEGTTLHTYVGQHVHNGERLRGLAIRWRDLMAHLKANHIAHADLQHGNVLVTGSGELRLVDYDGMFVPDLRGQPSRELGHPNYQHPQRAGADYDERLDNFAALVIYTSLVALSYDASLWAQFHTGENLIFSESDFKAPQKSPVFERLYHSPERVVRELAQRLILACEGTLARVPDFAQTLASVPDIPAPQPWWVTEGKPSANTPAPSASATSSSAASHDAVPEWWKAAEAEAEQKAREKEKEKAAQERDANEREKAANEEAARAAEIKTRQAPAPLQPASHAESETGSLKEFMLSLARLWNDSRAGQSVGAAQTYASPVPRAPSDDAAAGRKNAGRPRRACLTCSGVSCLTACLTAYVCIMLAQLIGREFSPSPVNHAARHAAVTRAPARPLIIPSHIVHPLAAPVSHSGSHANGKP